MVCLSLKIIGVGVEIWKYNNIFRVNEDDYVSPDVVCVHFYPLAWEGSTICGGGALHKNNPKTTMIDVESMLMDIVEFDSDIQHTS